MITECLEKGRHDYSNTEVLFLSNDIANSVRGRWRISVQSMQNISTFRYKLLRVSLLITKELRKI